MTISGNELYVYRSGHTGARTSHIMGIQKNKFSEALSLCSLRYLYKNPCNADSSNQPYCMKELIPHRNITLCYIPNSFVNTLFMSVCATIRYLVSTGQTYIFLVTEEKSMPFHPELNFPFSKYLTKYILPQCFSKKESGAAT